MDVAFCNSYIDCNITPLLSTRSLTILPTYVFSCTCDSISPTLMVWYYTKCITSSFKFIFIAWLKHSPPFDRSPSNSITGQKFKADMESRSSLPSIYFRSRHNWTIKLKKCIRWPHSSLLLLPLQSRPHQLSQFEDFRVRIAIIITESPAVQPPSEDVVTLAYHQSSLSAIQSKVPFTCPTCRTMKSVIKRNTINKNCCIKYGAMIIIPLISVVCFEFQCKAAYIYECEEAVRKKS